MEKLVWSVKKGSWSWKGTEGVVWPGLVSRTLKSVGPGVGGSICDQDFLVL